jgi:hypothetical protein
VLRDRWTVKRIVRKKLDWIYLAKNKDNYVALANTGKETTDALKFRK